MLHLLLQLSFALSHATLGVGVLASISTLMVPAVGAWMTLNALIHPQDAVFLIGIGIALAGFLGVIALQTWSMILALR